MNRYRPFASGDVNAFFGLTLDNIANLLLCVGLLSTTYKFPATFALQAMLPGTAVACWWEILFLPGWQSGRRVPAAVEL